MLQLQEQAVQRKLNVSEQPKPANVSFCNYLQQASEQPYPVAAVIFWSIEVAYYKVSRTLGPVQDCA